MWNNVSVSAADFMAAYKKAMLYGWSVNVVIPEWYIDGMTESEADEQDLHEDDEFLCTVGDKQAMGDSGDAVSYEDCVEFAKDGGWWDKYHYEELDSSYTGNFNIGTAAWRDEKMQKLKKEIIPWLIKHGDLYDEKETYLG